MSRMKKVSIKDRLLSDSNIFLAIYLVHSYIQEVGLLSFEDRMTLESLKDVYNKDLITNTINNVKARINSILDNDSEFFGIQVFFKPKKREQTENGYRNVFRPIHTAKLVDQIAMMAMAQILIYDTNSSDNNETFSLVSSELSRLIPSNFYGNRVSYDAARLFKPWQEQYHEYTSKASDYISRFSKSKEYEYEVSLDLKDFFPSIDPKVLFGLICSKLPLNLNDADKSTLHTIVKKLLIFKLEAGYPDTTCVLDENEFSLYLNISKEEAKHYVAKSSRSTYAKGLPQGLPHAYYFANIMMLTIKSIYEKVFSGKMLFYVDDSIIFTNNLNDITFKDKVKDLNIRIKAAENEYRNVFGSEFEYPTDYTYTKENFGIKVHEPGDKSTYSLISNAKEESGEWYLSGLCRETSTISADIYLAIDDEESRALMSRTEAILEAIRKEMDSVKNKNNKETYLKKLIRYRKFFTYRNTILKYRCEGDISELIRLLKTGIEQRGSNLEEFFDSYSDDVLAALIPYVLEKCQNENHNLNLEELKTTLEDLDTVLFGNSYRYSYIRKSTSRFYEDIIPHTDIYKSLQHDIELNYSFLTEQTHSARIKKLKEIVGLLNANYNELYNILEYSNIQMDAAIIRGTSCEIERRILNAITSYILGYDITDDFIFAKVNKEMIHYSELRALSALRNHNYDVSEFKAHFDEFFAEEFCVTADYTILQVMDTFKSFVIHQNYIDQLILLHKYCCDTWKNGSKHLYFYTIHNQEHAVALIINIRRIISAISCIEVKNVDYFILFASCYLHDISMVSLPDYNNLVIEDNEIINSIVTDFIERFDGSSTEKSKDALFRAYQDLDSFCESKIRSTHANDSADGIRKFPELDFIDSTMREIIARVSAGHGYDSDEVYYRKSHGKQSLVSEKLDIIILRLADLLDISRYRISRVIFDHNLHNINPTSRFHWISHLLTEGYTMESKYDFRASDLTAGSYIRSKLITETLTLTVNVLMSQTTAIGKKAGCKNVSNSTIETNNEDSVIVSLNCDWGKECKNNECNFLCKWFACKNGYLIEELAALTWYLNSLDNNYFNSCIELKVKAISNNNIPNDVFDYLKEYIED